MKQILLFIFVLSVFAACSFPRDNPLDPEHSGITAPAKVSNVSATGYNNPSRVVVTWDNSNADGYFIYRANYHDGNYRKIGEVTGVTIGNLSYTDSELLLAGQFYYYKVSGYKIIHEDLPFLEGELSDYDYAKVN
jgi:hypothetical protein